MADWKFSEDKKRVILDKPPSRPLKISGTRLGSVLGLNPWKSPFATWCEICRVHKDPFTESKYTEAGKTIEPILIAWIKEQFEEGVVSPEDFYGNTWKAVQKQYDFYKDTKIFGGMWDAKLITSKRDNKAIFEIKTTGRPQDWEDGVPDEKLVQALQYAYLDKAEKTFMVGAFLQEEDYQHPQRFVPVEGENTRMYDFVTDTATIMFDGKPTTISELIEYATEWWNAYVLTGISPEIDQKADADILKILRTQRPDEDTETPLSTMISLLDAKEAELAYLREQHKVDELENEIKALKDALKRTLIDGMGDDDDKVEIGRWSLSKTEKQSVDTNALKKAGLYDTYTKTSVSYTLRKTGEK